MGRTIPDTIKNNILVRFIHRNKLLSSLFLIFLLFFLVPVTNFDKPYSTVVLSRNGALLGARPALDGQWRFPASDSVPDKFKTCLIRYEDKYFNYHPGINPVSLFRAMKQNIQAGKIVSGASTISMQVIRLSGERKPRTILLKIIEMVQTLRLELAYSKGEILALYAAHAPFGGNVVGLEAASWRYFGCPASQLSWGESAGLAVLPNSPTQIFPGKNEAKLLEKRNKLLFELLNSNIIDSITYSLSIVESLPLKSEPLPDIARHLLFRCAKNQQGQIVQTTIDPDLQIAAQRVVDRQMGRLRANYINNSACVIAEVKTGDIVAYIGNADWNEKNGGAVDMITARRSTGSILKPFLFAAMLDAGKIMPKTLLPDLPLYFSGYTPQNFDLQFRGAVPAAEALVKSLNIPAVFMLRDYSPARFLDLLKVIGLSTFKKDADHYGLSLILGGGEATLEELVSAYGSMARVLNRFNIHGLYHSGDYHPINYLPSQNQSLHPDGKSVFQAASIWQTFQILLDVNRPEEESGWKQLSSSGILTWKTGTSFGFRDAWAVGVTPDYVIGVWTGNANGEGRPGLTGGSAAAPILFELNSLLKNDRWFEKPLSEMSPALICRESGCRASVNCPNVDMVMVPQTTLVSSSCPYHKILHLDSNRQYQVNTSCYPADRIINESWFILPPSMEFYYRKFHTEYRTLPPWMANSQPDGNVQMLDLIYPDDRLMVFLPKDMDGKKGQVIFQAAHRREGAEIYWHLDNRYLGTTRNIHQMADTPTSGSHKLVIVDDAGNMATRYFKVLE
jgi:penicillin-binding protein 1C